MRHYIIPIFIPHLGCPHTCVFCSQRRITGVQTNVGPAEIEQLLEFHLGQIDRPYFVEAAFYGGSFTALPHDLQRRLLAPAARCFADGRLQAIRISTRPDCIDDAVLALLWQAGVRTIELGAQSFDDDVLRQAERGHTAADIRAAAAQIRAAGFALGIQLMPGLPGDTPAAMQYSLQETLHIQPDIARIYPTIVIAGTRLAELYTGGRYKPLALADAVEIAAHMKLALERKGIRVIRTGLQSGGELDQPGTVLAGPYHPAFGEMVESWYFGRMAEQLLARYGTIRGTVVLHHAPADASKLRGVHRSNVLHWQSLYPEAQFNFCADGGRDAISTEFAGLCYTIDKTLLMDGVRE